MTTKTITNKANDEDNAIKSLLMLEHLKTTKSLRCLVADGLKRLVIAEENLERKNLFQSAIDLLEMKNLMTVHFEVGDDG